MVSTSREVQPWLPGDPPLVAGTYVSIDGSHCEPSELRLGRKRVPFCVVPAHSSQRRQDYISSHVKRFGRWRECDLLVKAWNHSAGSEDALFLDVGANIGACAVQMLASTRARLIAVEPNPNNLFFLTRSLGLPGQSTRLGGVEGGQLRERALVFPTGAGAGAATVSMVMDPLNQGNSAVSSAGGLVLNRMDRKENFTLIHVPDVPIRTLTELLDAADARGFSERRRVRLLKLDVQGYECLALRGAWRALERVDAVFSEADEAQLRRQGCSVAILRRMLERSGFEVAATRTRTEWAFEAYRRANGTRIGSP